MGVFDPPEGGKVISKTENFRCSRSVIGFLNAFRDDVKQHPAGENKDREGSVIFRLIKAEEPEMPRKRYSEEQISRALISMDKALNDWGWSQCDDVIRLFLVRQMIARRMGFTNLNRLFNGIYASSRAEKNFEEGEHFLLIPLTKTIYPLVTAFESGNHREIVNLLRRDSPEFATQGLNATKTLKTMIATALALVNQLSLLWKKGTIREVLQFCADHNLILISEKLHDHLERAPRTEQYDESLYSADKGDWLADDFFSMDTTEIAPYTSFITNNTVYSTQHGVKGEEYSKVIVVYDDVEASWNNYNFNKILTPAIAGKPTDGQLARGKKLAYVSFSRALEDLRVLFFTSNPEAARQELLENNMLKPSQIEVF